MEELLELRQFLEQGKIPEALLLVDELEQMSLSDKINKIDSYGVILLIHLSKKTNKRRKTDGNYLNPTELMDIMQQAYEISLKKAALETLEGRYETEELAAMVNKPEILTQALELMQK